MTRRGPPSNLGASVRARLLDLSRARKDEFQLVLSEFAIERLLYRLGASRHADDFVLKGAMLFRMWSSDRHRATWDLDLLGRGANGVAAVVAVLHDLCAMTVADGIAFDLDTIVGEELRGATDFAGVRVRLEARLADARIPMQIDVGFGDAATPAPRLRSYPTLLDHGAPSILAYERDTVVAEKLDAMITLGITNSRMKDFFDVHLLASQFAFDGLVLASAIRASLAQRDTPITEALPVALTSEFHVAPERQAQWRAFLRRARLGGPASAEELASDLQRFLGPVLGAIARGDDFRMIWPAGGPWGRAPT